MLSLPASIAVGDFLLSHLPPTRDIAMGLYDIFTKDAGNMRFWLRGEKIKSVDVVLEGIARAYRCDNMYMYQIFQNDLFVGEIGVSAFSEKNKSVCIDYWLAPIVRGKALIDKFLTVVENVVFNNIDINKVVLRIDVDNTSSRKVAARNGYVLDGILRAECVWHDGLFHDVCEYSKLKSEWIKEKRNA